jgi:dihydroneopterin aldolase
MKTDYTLKIQELSLHVHLGCSLPEQKHAQEVRVTAEIQFATQPKACHSDQLSDTVCYARICELFQAEGRIRPFSTIENLAECLFAILKSETESAQTVSIRVHKVHPPVDSLLGGAAFEIKGTQ